MLLDLSFLSPRLVGGLTMNSIILVSIISFFLITRINGSGRFVKHLLLILGATIYCLTALNIHQTASQASDGPYSWTGQRSHWLCRVVTLGYCPRANIEAKRLSSFFVANLHTKRTIVVESPLSLTKKDHGHDA